MRIKSTLASCLLAALVVVPAFVNADALNIVNGGFEIGNEGDSSLTPIQGWTDVAAGTNAGFWLTSTNEFSGLDAAYPQDGSLFLTAARTVGIINGVTSQPTDSTLSQTINLSAANLALVAGGAATVNLSFYYHDEDGSDEGTLTVTFLDGGSNELSSVSSGVLGNGDYSSSEWTLVEFVDWIDSATEAIRIDISTHRTGGTVTDLQYDSLSGYIEIPTPGEPGNRVFVDAAPENTYAWDGEGYDSGVYWTVRVSGNGDFLYQSDFSADSARLKTTVTGLPEGTYKVYAYFWAAGGGSWRMETALDDNPEGKLPLYYQSDYPANPDLYVHYLDSIGAIPWGSWTDPTPVPFYTTDMLTNPFGIESVKLAESNTRLIEVYLGLSSGTEISVYVDDDASASSQTQRTWYDGIGYEPFDATAPSVLSQYPEPDSYAINPDDFPLSIGATIADTASVLVDPSSIELYLNGGTNVITAGDVTQEGATLKTTTVSHETTILPDGVNSVDLVYSTYTFPSVYTTSTWTFVVASRGEPGTRVYVDADTINTLSWDGTTYGSWDPSGGTNWTIRADAGAIDDIYQSDYSADSVRLKTSATGLTEGFYKVYAYFWAAGGGANWRVGAALEDNPGGELPVYYQSDYPGDTNLYVHYQDALGGLPWGDHSDPTPNPYMTTDLLTNPFGTNSLKIAGNDLRLMEVYLGTVYGTEITVYLDDDVNADGQTLRTWYDGIGYEAYVPTATPDILSLSVSEGIATLIWESEAVQTYTIQHKFSLMDTWSDLKTDIPGGNPMTTNSVNVGVESQEFYQIKGK